MHAVSKIQINHFTSSFSCTRARPPRRAARSASGKKRENVGVSRRCRVDERKVSLRSSMTCHTPLTNFAQLLYSRQFCGVRSCHLHQLRAGEDGKEGLTSTAKSHASRAPVASQAVRHRRMSRPRTACRAVAQHAGCSRPGVRRGSVGPGVRTRQSASSRGFAVRRATFLSGQQGVPKHRGRGH